MTSERREFLQKAVEILVKKLKYDPEDEPEYFDEDDAADFENIRKVRHLVLPLRS
jgi:hypothetical protein